MIEQTKVSPPPGSVPTTSLPLTFFDLPWLLNFSHMQRPYFYDFPHPTNHFLETLLPSLKNSLPLTLQHFFLLAGNLRLPPPPAKPHILFTDGDSVSLTVVESTADFHFLSANHPLPVRAFDPFVPKFCTRTCGGRHARGISPGLASHRLPQLRHLHRYPEKPCGVRRERVSPLH